MDLRSLEIAWPETPVFELRPQRRRWPIAVAVAFAALAAAFAVPQSRAAILDLFDFGGVTIERVDTLPAAQERPLSASLGPVITRAQAPGFVFPPVPVTLHQTHGVVSMLFTYAGETVLVSEFPNDYPGILKKIVGPATSIERTSRGLWIEGGHVYLFPEAPPRLAGHVLLWQEGGLTIRLESRGLTKEQSLTLSLRIR